MWNYQDVRRRRFCLLRLIAGFEFPTSGSVLLDGKDIAPLPPFLPSDMPSDMKGAMELKIPEDVMQNARFSKRCTSEVRELYTKLWADFRR